MFKLCNVYLNSRCLGCRTLHTTPLVCGKKSRQPFDKRVPVHPRHVAPRPGKQGTNLQLANAMAANSDFVKKIGSWDAQQQTFRIVPEMIPEFVVPDLTGFTLKPYVSYKAKTITQSEFTAQDLFDAVYATKIEESFRAGDLSEKKLREHLNLSDTDNISTDCLELLTKDKAQQS